MDNQKLQVQLLKQNKKHKHACIIEFYRNLNSEKYPMGAFQQHYVGI